MRHKDKVLLARKMRTDLKEGLFVSPQWEKRKDAIATRVKKQQNAAHERALIRKGVKKEGFFAKRRRANADRLRREQERRARKWKYAKKHGLQPTYSL